MLNNSQDWKEKASMTSMRILVAECMELDGPHSLPVHAYLGVFGTQSFCLMSHFGGPWSNYASFLVLCQELILLLVNEVPGIHSAFKRMIGKLLLVVVFPSLHILWTFRCSSFSWQSWTLFCNSVDLVIRSHLEIYRLEMLLVSSLPVHVQTRSHQSGSIGTS